MKRKVFFFFTLALLLSVTTASLAETMQLNLEEAIGLGLKNSTTLKQKLLAVNAARAAVQAAKASYYPSVDLSATYLHLFKNEKTQDITFKGYTFPGSYSTSSDPVSISADLSQTIYTFGTLKSSVKIAEENLTLVEMELEEEKRDLIVKIKRAFYWYTLAGEVLRVQEETLNYKEEALNVARKRYDAGLIPDYEVLSAESDVENFKPSVISAANQLKYALLAVKDLLGVEDEGDFDVELIGELGVEYYEFDREELFALARRVKYEIGQYERNINLAALGAEITKNGKKPVVDGFVGYEVQSGFDPQTGKPRYWGEDSWEGNLSAGVRIQMPLSALFPWSKENADIVQSKLDLEQLRMGLDSLESGVRMNVDNVLLRLEEEKSKILSGEKGVELALRLYDSTKKRYENGMASNMELRDSQVSLNSAQLGYLKAMYDYNLALFDLMDAVGVEHF